MNAQINFDDPEVKRLLRAVVQANRSDPFTLDRIVAHLKSGILSLNELKGKPR